MKKAWFFLLSLLVGIQTISYGQLDRFESTILEYETVDKQNGPQLQSILFTGSSSIRMWETLAEDFSPMPVLNRGFGGSTIPEVIYYADRIIKPHQPKIIVFYCGENDLANDESEYKLALKSFKKFFKYMSKNLPDSKVFFLAMKPSIRRWNYWPKLEKGNQIIKDYIHKKDNFYFVDVASKMLDENGIVLQDIFIKDNLHMNAKGYKIWTEILKPVLEEHY